MPLITNRVGRYYDQDCLCEFLINDTRLFLSRMLPPLILGAMCRLMLERYIAMIGLFQYKFVKAD